ncbi:MAG: bifunctional ornithine acetyltransferase/N-acetylglutamate synthase, partial [Firmicutes bacterium]|nr:bifunctional ornithine acetyltransferase/N-acetylglutamate synthase [Bacillota bacterium]
MEWIEGGVTAARGYLASGVACGLKKDGRPDLALLVSELPAVSAGVFTTNQIKGHSLLLTQRRVGRPVRAVLANSGNANACLGPRGEVETLAVAGFAAEVLGLAEEEVLLGSTGVIGQPLDLEAMRRGILLARDALAPDGGAAAARAIMTTDTFPKEAAASLVLNGRTVRIGGMAKGSGMIHPNLATLLGFLTTDAPIGSAALGAALRAAAAVDPATFVTVLSGLDPDPAWQVRVDLANALGSLDRERALARLGELLGDGDQRVVASALRALAALKAPGLAATLRDHLARDDVAVRAAAAALLGALAPPGGEAWLAAAWERGRGDASYVARAAALGALAKYGAEAARGPLQAALA